MFVKNRVVPYTMKAPLQELERIEKERIITPVKSAEWAAPIAPIIMSDGYICVCGDYKFAINQSWILDNNLIPKIEDLFITLGGSRRCTKLDKSQTYQQFL